MSCSSAVLQPVARCTSPTRATRWKSRPRRPPVTSPADPTPASISFGTLDARVRAAVDSVARSDPNPADPFRGLYISDELALALAREGAGPGLDGRIVQAAARLGLTDLEAAVLAVSAAPELAPPYGRLYGYLHDDVTRKLASPR